MTDRRRTLRSVVVGGHRIDLLQREQLQRAITAALDGAREPLRLVSANLDHVYRFEADADLFATNDAGQWLVLLDGMPLVWAVRRKTRRDFEKLAGSDLLPDLLLQAEGCGARVGFLGGDETLRAPLRSAIRRRWPHLQVSGHWTPPREVIGDDEASSTLAEDIRAAGTDLLVVGLGKPRQEEWIARHAAATGATVTCAFGAAAEFVAGTRRRAPEVVSRLGGEWLYRLLHEPRRLARRYLAEGPVGLARVTLDVRVPDDEEERIAA